MAIDNPFANDVIKAIKEENKKTQDKLQKAANLEVASKEEIKELKKIAKGTGEEAKEANKKLRAELAKTSNKKEAQKTLKQQEENLKENQKISGLSAKRIQKADILAQSITKQKKIMEEQRGKLLRTLHENDLPEKHLLKVHQMIVGKNFSLDSHERILKHIFQIQGCSPLSVP